MSAAARKAGIRIAGDPGPGAARAFHDWQDHLDAGRLTAAANPTPSPEIAANRARTDAILRAHAAAIRATERAGEVWERE